MIMTFFNNWECNLLKYIKTQKKMSFNRLKIKKGIFDKTFPKLLILIKMNKVG